MTHERDRRPPSCWEIARRRAEIARRERAQRARRRPAGTGVPTPAAVVKGIVDHMGGSFALILMGVMMQSAWDFITKPWPVRFEDDAAPAPAAPAAPLRLPGAGQPGQDFRSPETRAKHAQWRAEAAARRTATYGHPGFLVAVDGLIRTSGEPVHTLAPDGKTAWEVVEQCDPMLARYFRSLGRDPDDWAEVRVDIGKVQGAALSATGTAGRMRTTTKYAITDLLPVWRDRGELLNEAEAPDPGPAPTPAEADLGGFGGFGTDPADIDEPPTEGRAAS